MSSDIQQQIKDHLSTAEALQKETAVIEQAAQLIVDAFKTGNTLYVLGNGGSAADAQHIAAELVGRFKSGSRPALPAVALSTNTSNLTAVGNDFGFDQVFVRQVAALVRSGDVVWALSVSGSSPNVLSAVKQAQDKGAKILGFTGSNGSQLQALSDVCLTVQHVASDRVQEVHQLAYHIICGLIEKAFT